MNRALACWPLLLTLGSCASVPSFAPSVQPSLSFRPGAQGAGELDGALLPEADEAAPQPPQETFLLPFFGDAAREKGYDLPRPIGVGGNFMFISRPTRITDVQAGVNGGPLNDVEFLSFDANASVRSMVGRVDAWVLPMLNVYLIGGYIWNTSDVRTTVELPGAPGTSIVTTGNLEGPTFGGGVTLAGGYEEFFAVADFNYTTTELGGLDEFVAKLYTIRLGWNTKLDGTPLRVYTGATYWDTRRVITGSIPLGGPVVNSVEFAVAQEPVDPMTAFVGGNVTLGDQLWLMLEVGGWEGTQTLIGGVQWRL